MEVTGIGSAYYDDSRFSSASAVHSPEKFTDILNRAKANQSEETSPVKTQIDKTSELYQLCLELETFLVKNLLTGMRNTVQKSGFIDNSFAGKMYEDMLYDEYAKDFTKNANFGLAEQAYRQLMKI
jgi:flagellar protein FlgJ